MCMENAIGQLKQRKLLAFVFLLIKIAFVMLCRLSQCLQLLICILFGSREPLALDDGVKKNVFKSAHRSIELETKHLC